MLAPLHHLNHLFFANGSKQSKIVDLNPDIKSKLLKFGFIAILRDKFIDVIFVV